MSNSPDNKEPIPIWPAEIVSLLGFFASACNSTLNLSKLETKPLESLAPLIVTLIFLGVFMYSQVLRHK